jgi:hypothetical protein
MWSTVADTALDAGDRLGKSQEGSHAETQRPPSDFTGDQCPSLRSLRLCVSLLFDFRPNRQRAWNPKRRQAAAVQKLTNQNLKKNRAPLRGDFPTLRVGKW